jgi:hypothetical protein
MADTNIINENTTNQIGLEKAIGAIGKFIAQVQKKTNGIIYGQYKLKADEGTDIQRALDKGIMKALDELVSVDFCNILNYLSGIAPQGKPFDPNTDITTLDPLQKKKFQIQKAAYFVQKSIDDYNKSYADSNNANSKVGLYSVIKNIANEFNDLISNKDTGLNDPELLDSYPQLSLFTNFIQDSLGTFNRYTDIRQIPNSELQKLISKVDKLRAICIAIVNLNDIGALLSLAATASPKIQQDLNKINKLINPKKIIPFLKNILNTAKNIDSIAKRILGFVNSARAIIKLVVNLIKIFKIIQKFIILVVIPAMFSPIGPIVGLSKTEREISNFIDKLLKRISQINSILAQMVMFITTLIIAIEEIISRLNMMLLNLDACSNMDPDLVQEIKDTVNQLQDSRNQLKNFIDTYNNNKSRPNNTFGEYTIQIKTEEVTDSGIGLKRRYGIALNSNAIVVVESTPTFASLDQIIINEVKVLLVSKGLVHSDFQTMSSIDISNITESLNYLADQDISITDIENIGAEVNTGMDAPNNENENDGIGLSAFVNKLQGGKKLRKRVREMMAKRSAQLGSDLKNTDPNQKVSSGVTPNFSNLLGSDTEDPAEKARKKRKG